MTDYLDEIQARADAATEGPWRPAYLDVVDGFAGRGGIYYRDTLPLLLTTSGATVANLQFIAHARTDVPRLVVALRAVEALHPALPIRLGFDAGKAMCGTCGTYAPCPTVTAIRDALAGGS